MAKGRPPKVSDDQKRQIAAEYAAGMSVRQIAQTWDISVPTVYAACKLHKVPLRSRPARDPAPLPNNLPDDLTWVLNALHGMGIRLTELRDMYDLTAEQVRGALGAQSVVQPCVPAAWRELMRRAAEAQYQAEGASWPPRLPSRPDAILSLLGLHEVSTTPAPDAEPTLAPVPEPWGRDELVTWLEAELDGRGWVTHPWNDGFAHEEEDDPDIHCTWYLADGPKAPVFAARVKPYTIGDPSTHHADVPDWARVSPWALVDGVIPAERYPLAIVAWARAGNRPLREHRWGEPGGWMEVLVPRNGHASTLDPANWEIEVKEWRIR